MLLKLIYFITELIFRYWKSSMLNRVQLVTMSHIFYNIFFLKLLNPCINFLPFVGHHLYCLCSYPTRSIGWIIFLLQINHLYNILRNFYSVHRNMALPVSHSNVLLFSHPSTCNKHSLKIFTPNDRTHNFSNLSRFLDILNGLSNIFTHFIVTTPYTFKNSVACHIFTTLVCFIFMRIFVILFVLNSRFKNILPTVCSLLNQKRTP
jgi:hypothetical protein